MHYKLISLLPLQLARVVCMVRVIETVELDERARVAELLGPLAREQLPGGLVPLDGLLGAVVLGGVAQLLEPLEFFSRRLVHPPQPNATMEDGEQPGGTRASRHP